jgi:PAS domain S-box-containing protein
MGSSHTRSHKGGNGKTKADLVQELKVLQEKVDFLTSEQGSKDELLERQLKVVIESMPAGVSIYDKNGRALAFNSMVNRIWGMNAPLPQSIPEFGEYKGWFADSGKPVQAEEWTTPRAIKSGEGIFGDRYDIQRFDGARGSIMLSTAPVKDPESNIIGWVAVIQDITERKRMEDEIRRSRDELELRVQERTFELQGSRDKLIAQIEIRKKAEKALQENQEELEAQAEELEAQTEELHVNNEELIKQIEEHNKAEKALRESELNARLRVVELTTTVESSLDGILIYDKTGKIIRSNEFADKYLTSADDKNVTVQERAARNTWLFPDGTPLNIENWPAYRALHGENVRDFEMIREINSNRMWVTMSTAPLLTDRGEIFGAVASYKDITEHKRAEGALQESKARAELRSAELDATLSSIAAGVMIYDSSGKLTRISDAALKMIGMTAADIDMDSYNQRMVAIGISKPDGTPLKKEESPYYRAMHGESIPGEVVMFKLKDREPVWVSTAASPIRSSAGEIMGAIAVFTDITEGKLAEEELKAAKAQADLYLDLMGHDISNMHQVAMGQLELAQDVIDTEGKLEAANREMIDTSLQSLWRSARLIDNVRKLQKIRSKDVNYSAISLDEVLAGSIKQYDGLYPDKSIKVDYGEGPHIVYANELLRDVFTNLIGNAIKHSNGGKVDISIKLEDMNDNGRKFFRISIEDDGPGIPDNLKDRIFNRLQRGESKARGMGLGLYLVKSLVESYNGKVCVEDRVMGDYSKGSRFVVLLPAMEI